MGGQNHQPTNTKITAASAWLSQHVGSGFIAALQANNHIESTIIIGMKRNYIEDLESDFSNSASNYMQQALYCLRLSLEELDNITIGFKRLGEIAERIGYKGNPLSSKVKSYDLMAHFDKNLIQPTINSEIWEELESRIQNDNILKTLEWEAEQFSKIVEPTKHLINVIEKCSKSLSDHGSEVTAFKIEYNEIPLRQYYARVFSLWNYCHAMFLYSSIIMTELFYISHSKPSLLDFDPSYSKSTSDVALSSPLCLVQF